MDRTSWIVVVSCLVLLYFWQDYMQKHTPVRPRPQTAPAAGSGPSVPSLNAPENSKLSAATSPPDSFNSPPEKEIPLENTCLRAVFTTHGGAIKYIELKQHRGEGGAPVTLNQGGKEGILNLSGWEGDAFVAPYVLESSTATEVVFTRTLVNGIIVHRSYQITGDYQLTLTQTVTNPTTQSLALPPTRLNVGTIGPIHLHDQPSYIQANWMTDQDLKLHSHNVLEFSASNGFLGLFPRPARSVIPVDAGPLGWIAVKNQFFTLILTAPESRLPMGVECQHIPLPFLGFKTSTVPAGVDAVALFPDQALEAGAARTETYSLYAGPKEYSRLHTLGRHEDLVMEFGFWSWVIKPLLWTMKRIHDYVGNWGLSIILLTLIIKLSLFPFQTAANKNMKQMQAIQPKVKVLQDKFKDDAQKLNVEMMKLYREYGVNPIGGCLPLLVQMPIFIGFYTMLRSAIELRNGSFLWIHDLSQPDTIATIPGIGLDLNPLPLIMTLTSVILMRMTPQTTDNPQMKAMQFMPLVFLAILYNFASALSLYWTINNLLSIVQTIYNLRQPVPELKRIPKKKSGGLGQT